MRINITDDEFHALNEAYEFILTNTECISDDGTACEMRILLNNLFDISQKYKMEAARKEDAKEWLRMAKKAAPEATDKELRKIVKKAKKLTY